MNTAEQIDQIIYLEALAREATAQAKIRREVLDQKALTEYHQNGVAPSWRSPSANVPFATEDPRYTIVDEQAWQDWVFKRYPTEIIETISVRTTFQTAMLKNLAKSGDTPITEDGEIIPGLMYHPGGTPKRVQIRPNPGVRDLFAQIAATQLAHISDLPRKEDDHENPDIDW